MRFVIGSGKMQAIAKGDAAVSLFCVGLARFAHRLKATFELAVCDFYGHGIYCARGVRGVHSGGKCCID
jgi:hypothetical protein